MRYLLELLSVCALVLSVASLMGCGGLAPCEGVICDDRDACTEDACNVETGMCEFTTVVICDDGNDCTVDDCDRQDGSCEYFSVEDGTLCAEGLCIAGECGPIGSVFPCTEIGIRSAIATGGGPFMFDCDGVQIVRTEAEIVIDNDVILDGEDNLTIDGGDDHRVLNLSQGVTATLRGMTIQRGYIGDGNGGGIATGGTLTLTNCRVAANAASSSGCLRRGYGGGMHNTGTLTLVNSTVAQNRASDSYCSLTGETYGGIGGGIDNRGTLTLTNSTVSYNIAEDSAGGIRTSAALTLTNSTVSANLAEAVGGISGLFESFGSIVSANIAKPGVDNCAGFGLASLGYNVESPGDTCGFEQPTDQVNVSTEDLALGPLQYNGGPTMTRALGEGSVAIDVIPEAECLDADGEPLMTDQRGEPRPETGGSMCDVGSFERQPEDP